MRYVDLKPLLKPDRASNIRKLQRCDHLPQPSVAAVNRHRERRRDIQRAKNLQAMREGR